MLKNYSTGPVFYQMHDIEGRNSDEDRLCDEEIILSDENEAQIEEGNQILLGQLAQDLHESTKGDFRGHCQNLSKIMYVLYYTLAS